MARVKDTKPSRERTPSSDLDRLPQFEPDHTYRLDETRHESVLPVPRDRADQIRNILSSAMKGHVREAFFLGKPTSLERFMDNAMLAIANYESRSVRRRNYDRRKASRYIKNVRVALWSLQRTLERATEWNQLDQYLERLFIAECKQRELERGAYSSRLSAKALVKRRKLADRYREQFRLRSPRAVLNQLVLLEPTLTLALEKLKFQPGDFQRDEIAREFANEMAFAWMSATGTVPTISKSKPMPFQLLLATINRNILEPQTRHRTDFRYLAVSAAGEAQKRSKGDNPRR